MNPNNPGSHESRRLSKSALQLCTHRESPESWQIHKRMMKSEFGRKEVLHPVAAQDFGAHPYTLACCGAEEACKTWMFLGPCILSARGNVILGSQRGNLTLKSWWVTDIAQVHKGARWTFSLKAFPLQLHFTILHLKGRPPRDAHGKPVRA